MKSVAYSGQKDVGSKKLRQPHPAVLPAQAIWLVHSLAPLPACRSSQQTFLFTGDIWKLPGASLASLNLLSQFYAFPSQQLPPGNRMQLYTSCSPEGSGILECYIPHACQTRVGLWLKKHPGLLGCDFQWLDLGKLVTTQTVHIGCPRDISSPGKVCQMHLHFCTL